MRKEQYVASDRSHERHIAKPLYVHVCVCIALCESALSSPSPLILFDAAIGDLSRELLTHPSITQKSFNELFLANWLLRACRRDESGKMCKTLYALSLDGWNTGIYLLYMSLQNENPPHLLTLITNPTLSMFIFGCVQVSLLGNRLALIFKHI